MRHTYTYVVMEVSESAYKEIREKLEATGYRHAMHESDEHGVVLDMHGIAIAKES